MMLRAVVALCVVALAQGFLLGARPGRVAALRMSTPEAGARGGVKPFAKSGESPLVDRVRLHCGNLLLAASQDSWAQTASVASDPFVVRTQLISPPSLHPSSSHPPILQTHPPPTTHPTNNPRRPWTLRSTFCKTARATRMPRTTSTIFLTFTKSRPILRFPTTSSRSSRARRRRRWPASCPPPRRSTRRP